MVEFAELHRRIDQILLSSRLLTVSPHGFEHVRFG